MHAKSSCSELSNQPPYLRIIHHLLGVSDDPIEPSSLPCEVKYVLVALTCQNGPLSDLSVASGLLTLTEATPKPAHVSLLSKCSTWTDKELPDCLEVRCCPSTIFEVR